MQKGRDNLVEIDTENRFALLIEDKNQSITYPSTRELKFRQGQQAYAMKSYDI